jgi:hypothetical protein
MDAAVQQLRDLGGRIVEQHIAEMQPRQETKAEYQQRCIQYERRFSALWSDLVECAEHEAAMVLWSVQWTRQRKAWCAKVLVSQF